MQNSMWKVILFVVLKSIDICRKNIWRNSQIVTSATWGLEDQERKRAFTLYSSVMLDFTIISITFKIANLKHNNIQNKPK